MGLEDNDIPQEGHGEHSGPSITSEPPAAGMMGGTPARAPTVGFVDDIKESTSVTALALGVICFPITVFSCICLDPKEEAVCNPFVLCFSYVMYTCALFPFQSLFLRSDVI